MHIRAATGLGASAYNLEMVEMGIQLDNMVCTHKYHELRPKLWALGQLQEEGMDISLLEVFFFLFFGWWVKWKNVWQGWFYNRFLLNYGGESSYLFTEKKDK